MKKLLFIFTVLLSMNSFSASTLKNISCVTSEGMIIKYDFYNGELSAMESNGNVILDHEDGYNHDHLSLETFPVQNLYMVYHHELPKEIVLRLTIVNEFKLPYSGSFKPYGAKEAIAVKCF